MSIKTSEVKVGDVLHDVHTYQAGNTAMRLEGHWTAKITAVAEDGSWVEASWNGNTPRRYVSVLPKSWKRTPKEWVRGLGGRACTCCRKSEKDGHADDCDHPRAVSARKKLVKVSLE